ncbi:hypothetical protein Dda_8855 [Drechslerella dactyloides]|uniref:FAD-dependent urate hydroxylase HpyO/Asp monooxygenase CreE-like FAD/NAD(P)-binding domain-containing protein n=1 Tax=Drechslerella dactyloides TaxID=74499 RepID=A0AAD6NFN4_DREDA|nr:hypothetical protein Dda_8855 [Drechslerella dactyloides]
MEAMDLAVVSTPRAPNVRRIATVGGGPAALSFLLQLKSKLDATPTATRSRIEITVLDKSAHFGPGQGFARAQSGAYRLNFPRELMEPVADTIGNFSAWLRVVAPQCTTEYPSRRLFGIYLEQLGKRLLAEAAEDNPRIGIKFLPHREVISIECDDSPTPAPFRVRHSSVGGDGCGRGYLEVDEVVLCTGTVPCDNYQEFRDKEGYGHDAESIRRLMAGLRGDETIGTIGSRLSAIDVAMELRKRGHHGEIIMGSHNGLLPAVGAFYTVKEVPMKAKGSCPRREGGSANRTVNYLMGRPASPPACFSSPSQPPSMTAAETKERRCNGLRHLHPSLVSESAGTEELTMRFFAEINTMVREDWHRDASGAHDPPLASYEKMVEYLANVPPREWLDRQIRRAERGVVEPYHALFFQLYPHIPKLWARLPEQEKSRYFEKVHWLFMSYFSGFPLENAWPMREMLSNGRLTVLRDCKFTRGAGGFVIEGRKAGCKETESRRVSRLFNASGLGSDARSHPLYSKLVDSGLLRPHRFGGVEFELDTYRAISNRTKAPNPSLYVIGEMTKGQILITSCMGIIAKQAERVAAQVLNRIAEGLPGENYKLTVALPAKLTPKAHVYKTRPAELHTGTPHTNAPYATIALKKSLALPKSMPLVVHALDLPLEIPTW